ncbi:MAG: PAS domain-containing protein [Gammaproteobacteria bacterium]
MDQNIANKTREGSSCESDVSVTKGTSDEDSQIKVRLEALLRSQYVIDQIHDAVIATDLNGSIIAWNKGAENQLGYSSSEILNTSVYRLYPEERHGHLTSEVLDILQSKGNFEIEATMRRKSGEVFFALTSISPLADETGEVIGIISYSLDISERKKIEQSLKESEERLKLAIAGADDGIWDWDIHTNKVYYSSRFKALRGYTKEE